jgi:hypothetical protein
MGGSISCPSEFMASPSGVGCIVRCPTNKNYEMKSIGAMIACTHKGDPSASVPLVIVPSYWIPDGSSLQPNASYTSVPNNNVYASELKRFNDALAVADANIDKNTKLTAAFNTLQAAENARDTAPDAYQAARVAYYTLLKGDTWINEEKNRVANTEAQPVINEIIKKYQSVQSRRSQQQATIDAMNNVKQSVLGVKDDLNFSVSNFQKHIDDITNQINKDKRKQNVELVKSTSWIEVFLNWLIALTTLMAIFFLVRYFMRPKPVSSTQSAFGSQPRSPVR